MAPQAGVGGGAVVAGGAPGRVRLRFDARGVRGESCPLLAATAPLWGGQGYVAPPGPWVERPRATQQLPEGTGPWLGSAAAPERDGRPESQRTCKATSHTAKLLAAAGRPHPAPGGGLTLKVPEIQEYRPPGSPAMPWAPAGAPVQSSSSPRAALRGSRGRTSSRMGPRTTRYADPGCGSARLVLRLLRLEALSASQARVTRPAPRSGSLLTGQ